MLAAHCADDGPGALSLLLNMFGAPGSLLWLVVSTMPTINEAVVLSACYFMLKLESLLKQGLDVLWSCVVVMHICPSCCYGLLRCKDSATNRELIPTGCCWSQMLGMGVMVTDAMEVAIVDGKSGCWLSTTPGIVGGRALHDSVPVGIKLPSLESLGVCVEASGPKAWSPKLVVLSCFIYSILCCGHALAESSKLV
ncbi:hypothetical protein Nepgr_030063 [Nepenthes gracilis]|uniref:Uncharacterized protein n=1 Tax=Nepenthes gracilis TaxID=150966 RepID=A0AAD3TDV8_NEPGR|nr:hypothetical protein Nepgr_030063 [Nepenthes gracilis]